MPELFARAFVHASVRSSLHPDNFLEITDGAINLKGEWTVLKISRISNKINKLKIIGDDRIPVNAEKIDKLDTTGAWLIQNCFRGHPLELTKQQQKLFKSFSSFQEKKIKKDRKSGKVPNLFITVGQGTHHSLNFLYEIFSFIGQSAIRLVRNFFGFRHFRLPAIVRHIYETGFRALPIIGTVALGMSAVISYQAAMQLQKFGADIFTVDLTVISILREMAVLVTAIMIAGRSGSAFAAEIGVMKLRGEVDALQVMGMNPVETLVLPRLLALVITLPLLTFYAEIVGLAGGGFISSTMLNMSWLQYIERVESVATPTMFFAGIIKAPVFALMIAIICTYQGMSVSGSAESVGKLTTIAVVQSIFMVLIVDALFSIVFSEMGI